MNPVAAIALVFFGGVLGGLGRWGLAQLLPERVNTFAANVTACAIAGVALAMPGSLAVMVGAGIAGALSTWSTFASEMGRLIKASDWAELAKYALFTQAIGLCAVWFGHMCASMYLGA